jgi:hypothetical protein
MTRTEKADLSRIIQGLETQISAHADIWVFVFLC